MKLHDFCPVCFRQFVVEEERILDDGHQVDTCPNCETPIKELFGCVVRDVARIEKKEAEPKEEAAKDGAGWAQSIQLTLDLMKPEEQGGDSTCSEGFDTEEP